MRKFNSKKIVSLFLALMMLVGIMSISAFAAETEEQTESVSFVSKNIAFGEKVHLMFAVPAAEIEGKEVVTTVKLGDETSTVSKGKNEIIDKADNKVECAVFTADLGVAAQDIDAIYTVTIEVNGEVVADFTYSVLEYLYERKFVSDNVREDQYVMYDAFLAYAGALDTTLATHNDGTLDETFVAVNEKYVYVNTVDCTFDGGKTAGIVEKGAALADVASDLVVLEGGKLVYNVADFDGTKIATVEDIAAYAVETNCVITAEAQGPNVKEVIAILASFDFGANGNAKHEDGSAPNGNVAQFVDGEYAISFINGAKFYTGAFDAKGNSALKFGTDSVAGEVEFTVADDVTSVVIYVAGYKANNATVSINGTDHSVTTHSDDGAYTAIEIDTTEEKIISFATTTTSYRCMINKIEYIGTKTVPAHDCVFAGATCVAKATCTECGALDVEGEFGAHVWDAATCTAPKTCSACGETDGAANGHSYDEGVVTTAPGCLSSGEKTFTCTVCDNKKTESIAALGHTTDSGVCGNCGEEIGATDLQPKSYSYAFANKVFTANGTQDLGGVKWTLAGDGGYWGYDSNAKKGQQFGSSGKPYKTLTLTSTVFSNVSKITINTSGASSVKATLSVYVGGVLVGEPQTITSSATTYTFDVDGLSGEIQLVYTQSSAKAIYIKQIAVDYAE